MLPVSLASAREPAVVMSGSPPSFQKTSLSGLEGYYLAVPVSSRFDHLSFFNLSSLVLSYNVLVVSVVLLFLSHLRRTPFLLQPVAGDFMIYKEENGAEAPFFRDG